ncbi:hypothetical protein VL20_1358 [Microcystis panniformis FACHB-1757]|uniref:Uncharacterized protein n=1 Tax=Microcystis panniformis FACHB-1757 TaxID=1638788 RepID=A0A0K1RXB5_9CHRO|nr:hypothetical protein VL20_1358 [Microcystis panniformis FACHB-1757]
MISYQLSVGKLTVISYHYSVFSIQKIAFIYSSQFIIHNYG